MQTPAAVFSVRTIAWLVALGAVSFAGALILSLFGADILPVRSSGSDTYSVSALGHRGLAETLRRLGIPVAISRHDPAAMAGPGGLLISAEPPLAPAQDGSDAEPIPDVEISDQTLAVLPKRQGSVDLNRPQWLESVRDIPLDDVQAWLRVIVSDPKAIVVRESSDAAFDSTVFESVPDLPAPQLVRSSRLRPIIANESGILLGEIDVHGSRVWLLSDPDLIANHGLHRGENAALAVGIIEALRPAGGLVVFDETIHGLGREPNVWAALFEFPMVLGTIQAAAAAALLVWASVGRFGAPRPPPATRTAGKRELIDNIAAMLAQGGHLGAIVGRYLDVVTRDVARLMNAPRALDDAGLESWLGRIERARGARTRHHRLQSDFAAAVRGGRAVPARLLRVAARAHLWRRDIVRGTRTR